MPTARRIAPRLLSIASIFMVAASAPVIASSYVLTDLGRTTTTIVVTNGDTNFDSVGLTPSGQIVHGYDNTKNGAYSIQNIPDYISNPLSFTLNGPGGQSSTLNLNGTRANGLSVYGFAVNASGTVVGTRFTYGNFKFGDPIEYTAQGGMVVLPSLEGVSTALAINKSGLIVGEAYNGSDNERAFLIHDQMVTDLNSLIPPGSGFKLAIATGIDDAGRIVGYATDAKDPGHVHEFLLTPTVPEPATFWVIGVGVGCFAWLQSRARGNSNRDSAGLGC